MNDDWADQGACRPYPSEWWHPDYDHQKFYEWARPICLRCPVQTECLEYALATQSGHQVFGMWGAKTPGERNGKQAGHAEVALRLTHRERPCDWCRKPFAYKSTRAKYCSRSCSNRAYEAWGRGVAS